jgi:hypothetical protein
MITILSIMLKDIPDIYLYALVVSCCILIFDDKK